ncbi:MAG TPA: tetratricopeptide repeat protein [Nostocaceae cyanobacterium]|nr:tetratricopeptide repeat protein [Nostocaceae cyanobacterium]
MNSPSKPKSLQEKIKRTQPSNFVGREDQINQFQQNLALSPEDDQRRCIFNVWGQGGVGKSTLLKQFRKIAEEAKIVTAYIDDAKKSIPEVMGHLAEDLEKKGHKLPQFSERYKVFRQKRQELETDPEAPKDFSVFLGKTAIKTGVKLARNIPGAGVPLSFVDEDALANQAGEWTAYVAKKINNKDEVQLVQQPLKILTPLFVQDIYKLSEKISIALFFDTYECTGEFLDQWLRDILEGHYGFLPVNILIVIAGRDELDKNLWAGYDGVLARFSLEAFTEAEAKQYLTRKGITNNNLVEVILQLSGCLPLLVGMLADANPTDTNQIIEPSSNAVERFLKWIDDPKKRQIALDAALSRCLNRDVIAKLRTEAEADELFYWLKETSFVNEKTDGWVYHDVVRTLMLRSKRLTSPQSWADLHGKLAEYYEHLRNELQLEEQNKYSDVIWQNYTLHFLYHRLCQAPQKNLTQALNEFLAAIKNKRRFAKRLAETMSQAGKDADFQDIKNWGEQLVNGLIAYDEERYEMAIEMFTELLRNDNIDVKSRAVALGSLGDIYRQSHQYMYALDDLTKAIELAPDEAEYLTDRGATYRVMKQYPEALLDLNKAIELNPKSEWAFANRGLVYHFMERYPEALLDFNEAIKLNSQYTSALVSRGKTYRLMARYPEALQDLNQAIELNPKSSFALANRGETYRLMGRYPEALQDLDKAIELNPEDDWTLANRGETYRLMGRYPEAIQNLDQAIALNPKSDFAFAHRGETYRLMARYPEALQDFDQAIKLNPQSDWVLAHRGETYRLMEQYQKALRDLDQAIALNPHYTWALASRGETYRLVEQYQKALRDLDQAIALNPHYTWALANRGETYRLIERYPAALRDLDQAIKLNPQDDLALAHRGYIYLMIKQYNQTLTDFNQAIELDSNNDWYLYLRAILYKALNQPNKAQADLKQAAKLAKNAFEKEPKNWKNTFNLAIYYLAAQYYQPAEKLYKYALANRANLIKIKEAIRHLKDFLKIFPDNLPAQAMLKLLQSSLSSN